MITTPQQALTVLEFCERFRISRPTAYREIAAGRLRIRKVGKKTIIAASDADAWLRALPTEIRKSA